MALFTKPSQDFIEDIKMVTKKKHILINVYFELTYKCNLNCRHCYIVENRKKRELEYKEVCSILDQIRDTGCIFICFTGGEIFVRDDILDILSYARTKGLLIRIFTNGTLITPTIANRLKKLAPSSIAITLYGASEKSYKEFTGISGAYNRVIKGIRLLVKRGIRVNLHIVIVKNNVDELSQLQDLARSLGAHSVQYGAFMFSKANGSLEPLKCELPLDLTPNLILKYALRHYSRSEALSMLKKKSGPHFSDCTAGSCSCAISPYAEVYPCLLFKGGGISWPNLRKENLLRIWQNPIFNKLRDIDLAHFVECKNCNLKNYCTLCYAEYYKSNYNKQEPNYCRLAAFNKMLFDQLNKK